jgi:agmatine deiminase
MKRLPSTPRDDGFRMPGEFEPHEGTFMVWPERSDNWRYGGKYAQKVFAEVANTIARFEKMTVCASASQYENARNMLNEEVRVVEVSTNDSWVRDSGPTFVVNDQGTVRGVDWRFNAWGGLVDGLYFPWDKDDQVARKICEMEFKDYYSLKDFILEGGSIHVDGEGTCIVTESCLLSAGRNPHMSKEAIEEVLKAYLNVETIIWLKYGIYLDETNEHVDNICAYVKPGVVVLGWTEDENDPQYAMSKSSYDILTHAVDAKGRKLEVHKLVLPKVMHITEEESQGVDSVIGSQPRKAGERLAASYVNYYICNKAIIMPGFNEPNDAIAKKKLEELYPDREVIQIYAREILLGGGNIHCITQQQPK